MTTRQIIRTCKMQGLSLHSDALQYLVTQLTNEPTLQLDDVLFAIKNSIDRSKMTTSVVSLEALASALDTLLTISEENHFEPIKVFQAFDIPQLLYNLHNNAYELQNSLQRPIHASVDWQLRLFRDRFISVEKRVRRNKMFSAPTAANALGNANVYMELVRIESLMGATGLKFVIGMLGQDERKRYYLEDTTSRVYIDLSNAVYTLGLFTLTCIVLVEGEVIDDILHVRSMGLPPPEHRVQSLGILGGLDPLGVEISREQYIQMANLEQSNKAAMFIVLSDVHLDDDQVITKLEILFRGLEAARPTLFIMMGDFLSYGATGGSSSVVNLEEVSLNPIQDLKDALDSLANLILQFPLIAEHSQFILVPGPNDPGSSSAFPRHPLPTLCTEELMRKLPKTVICATNPVRLRYYTQDIVVFRENLQQKMHHHAIVPILPDEEYPEEAVHANTDEMQVDEDDDGPQPLKLSQTDRQVDISKHLIRTIVNQGHLCPLPLSVCPINWAFDSSLYLFPLPDVLILGDSTEQFQKGYASVAVFHPGPFHVDYSFVLYRPSTNVTEFSSVA